MAFRRSLASIVLFASLVAACSSGSTGGTVDGGSSGNGDGGSSGTSGGLATPRVIFDSAISPGTHTAAECGKTGTWFTVGSFGNPASGEAARPVDDGAAEQQGNVSVSCSVRASGGGFDVSAHAQLTGSTGGAVTLTGTLNASGESKGVSLQLTKLGETFSGSSCVASFDVASGEGIAAGRVWADITCADVTYPAAQKTCSARAQLRFENCAQ